MNSFFNLISYYLFPLKSGLIFHISDMFLDLLFFHAASTQVNFFPSSCSLGFAIVAFFSSISTVNLVCNFNTVASFRLKEIKET